ncbi:DUF2080 family transposase-associated protein [archaeon]|nr:DUF2080 family transposase-associated protein [archaeon]
MEQYLKLVKQVGNSAGVLLPRKLLGSYAKVIIIKEKENIEKDIIQILQKNNLLIQTKGIYLYGSYARGEQTEISDIDILVITNKTSKRIKHGKYSITVLSEKELEKNLKEGALILIAILAEAKTLMNEELIKKYPSYKVDESKIYNQIRTALKIYDGLLKLEENKSVSDNLCYGPILHTRSLYLLEKLKRKEKLINFKNFIKKITGNDEIYKAYLRTKNNKKVKKIVLKENILKLYEYLNKELEKWEGKRNKRKG